MKTLPFNAHMKLSIIALLILLTFSASYSRAEEHRAYDHRWTVLEQPPGRVRPPLKLLWEKSPISFPNWNPAGFAEWSSRRIALTVHGFVTVIRKTLYLLDKDNGSVLWTRLLPGDDIKDWVVAENLFLFASIDYKANQQIRGAMDISERKEKWVQKEPQPSTRPPERLLVNDKGLVVYFSDGPNSGVNDAITALDSMTGEVRWWSATDVERVALVQLSWFIYGKNLHALVKGGTGGLFVKRFSLADGEAEELRQIHSSNRSTAPPPLVISATGNLIVGYNSLLDPIKLTLVAYDLNSTTTLWSRVVGNAHPDGLDAFRHVMLAERSSFAVATLWADRFIVFNPETGTLIRDGRIPGYIGWVDRNASLLSYPYLFTGAKRKLSRGMAFDLVALNLETGKVDWSYELETDSGIISTPSRDILNFVVKDDLVYIGRSDAKIMAFRHGGTSSTSTK